MKSFNEWYTKINEEIAEPVAKETGAEATAEPTANVTADRDSMISDIDTIMTSLETLASELSESLNEEVNEADTEIGAITQGAVATGAAVGVAAAWAIKKLKAMKAKKSQEKANAMLMKVEVSKIKARDIEDPNAKKAVNAKIESMEDQAKQLQDTIDSRYGDEAMSMKAVQSEKLKGKIERIELLAKETGSESYKKEIGKLNKQYKETITELERLKKEGEEQSKMGDDAADAETKAEREVKNSKEGQLDRLNTLLKKAQEEGDEEKAKKVQELIDKVSAKESWQLEGTQLGMLIEAEIVKLENEQKLNESITLSIKERFSKLI